MVMSFLDLDNEEERFVEVFVDAREEVDTLDNHILIRFEDTFILIGVQPGSVDNWELDKKKLLSTIENHFEGLLPNHVYFRTPHRCV